MNRSFAIGLLEELLHRQEACLAEALKLPGKPCILVMHEDTILPDLCFRPLNKISVCMPKIIKCNAPDVKRLMATAMSDLAMLRLYESTNASFNASVNVYRAIRPIRYSSGSAHWNHCFNRIMGLT